MWIRTQDRKTLVPLNKQVSVNRGGTISMVFEEDNNSILYLGHYKTEERALEVLDEIQQHIIGSTIISVPQYENKYDCTPVLQIVGYEDEKIQLPVVYDMPKE